MDTQIHESEILVQARTGDRKALAELVEMARVRMFPVAYAELRHYDDAQDAVGSALLQLCTHLKDLRDPERLRPWMYSIVRNEARRLRRSRLPEAPEPVLDVVEEPSSPLPSSLLRIDVERALYRLPWDEARAVALFYLKGQSIREIAHYVERPEGTVKRWLHLGRQQLARELEAYAPMTPVLKRRLRRVLIHAVDEHPTRVATDPASNRIYIARAGGITIIDGSTNNVEARVQVGPIAREVMALAIHPTTHRIYVTHPPADPQEFSGALSVIDGESYEVIAVVAVGNTPRAAAVNPKTNQIYVVSAGENVVNVVDGDSNQVAATVEVGSEPISLAVNSDTNKVYVANWGSCTVSVLDGAVNRVMTEIAVGAFPMDLAINQQTNRIYVANSEEDTISVVDGATDTIIETIPVGRRPVGIAINPATNEIYVTHSPAEASHGTLRLIDGSTNHLTATTRVGAGLRNVSVDPSTNRVYVANGVMNTVSVIRAA